MAERHRNTKNMTEKINCLIIGSGPAGYTAAIYASRANLKPVLYQGLQPGGQLMITTDVENYPGYPDGVMGPQMMMDFEKQARNVGCDVRYGMVTKVELNTEEGGIHRAQIDDDLWVEAHSIIISTGASAKWLGIESEEKFNGKGVSACAVCDGFFFKGKTVAIVGAGDTAAEEALYLANLCPTVHMIIRRDVMRASKILQDKVMSRENIIKHWNTETDEILGGEDGNVGGVRVKNNKTGETTTLDIKGFFVAIGHTPNSQIFSTSVELYDNGYIKTKAGTTETNMPGIFACGDVQDFVYRQAVTAAGTGCMAALDAEKYLMRNNII